MFLELRFTWLWAKRLCLAVLWLRRVDSGRSLTLSKSSHCQPSMSIPLGDDSVAFPVAQRSWMLNRGPKGRREADGEHVQLSAPACEAGVRRNQQKAPGWSSHLRYRSK